MLPVHLDSSATYVSRLCYIAAWQLAAVDPCGVQKGLGAWPGRMRENWWHIDPAAWHLRVKPLAVSVTACPACAPAVPWSAVERGCKLPTEELYVQDILDQFPDAQPLGKGGQKVVFTIQKEEHLNSSKESKEVK